MLEGSGERVALAQEWPHGAAYDDASGRAEPAAVLGRARLGPRPAVVPAVPGLRRAGDDVRHAVVAVRRADAGARARRRRRARRRSSRAARLAYDNQRKDGRRACEDALIARLDPDDEHAALVRRPRSAPASRTSTRSPQLLADAPGLQRRHRASCGGWRACTCRPTRRSATAFKALRVAERAHEDAAATDAERATDIAALLRRALAVRDPDG